jgi:hypothetical protein
MSWQKCPICNGTGDDPFVLELPRSTWPCPTCKGERIISELTGLPPTQNSIQVIEPAVWPAQSINSKINSNVSHIQTTESQVREP